MVALLPAPELQFIDADGHPYAGGTLTTYVPGTTTPKTTWVDPNEAAANSNPIVLDAAGRAIVFGDGAYRIILRDSSGNLIYDQISDTIVSAAMQPVMSAATIADAVNLLGINTLIANEAAARSAADSAEQAARIAADNAETARAEAAEANLQSQIDALNALVGTPAVPVPGVQFGQSVYTDGTGHARVTFGTAYTVQVSVVVQISDPTYSILDTAVLGDLTGFDVYFSFPSTGGPSPAGVQQFEWISVGS